MGVKRDPASAKIQEKRNQLGQFTTPMKLANEMLEYSKPLLSAGTKIRFLDPAFGTGSFYSALLRTFPASQIESAVGYEIDPDCARVASESWKGTQLQLNVADFTKVSPPQHDNEKFSLIICNPPYVRHHYLTLQEKQRLMQSAKEAVAITLNGLTGLHCYFLCLSDKWMAQKALAGWLVPSEFMDVKYGKGIREYLLTHVTLLRVHRFDPIDVQFEDALVSSAIVWFKKARPPVKYAIEFTQGGTLLKPSITKTVSSTALRRTLKWGRLFFSSDAIFVRSNQKKLRDLFEIKRGLATGADKFFILTAEAAARHKIPPEFLKPILPQPRHLSSDEIQADNAGNTVSDTKLFLLTCDVPESVVKNSYPTLWKYLQIGVEQKINQHYLCANRSPWYSQEERPPPPLLCRCMGRRSIGRDKPIRFILNHSSATATNAYLVLYPKRPLRKTMGRNPKVLRAIWQALNKISWLTLISEGRTYGGGLCKIEPRELGNAPADGVIAVLSIS